jgi:hypothetical protein
MGAPAHGCEDARRYAFSIVENHSADPNIGQALKLDNPG